MVHGTNLGLGLVRGLVRGSVLDLEGETREALHLKVSQQAEWQQQLGRLSSIGSGLNPEVADPPVVPAIAGVRHGTRRGVKA
jgi:hypothetical protein